MKKVKLKNTGLVVSQLCFGTGRIQKLTDNEGGVLLKKAFEKGVYFWDTSDDYNTHRHVKQGLKGLNRKDIILMSKITRMYDKEKVKSHIDNMLKELGTDYLDIIILHAVDSKRELRGYLGIIEELKKTPVKHIGLSSHNPERILDAANIKDVEFVMAPLNYKGMSIKGYHLEFNRPILKSRMTSALKECRKKGKDIFIMKIFSVGRIKNIEKAINFGLEQDFADGINLGITNEDQLNLDVEIIEKFETL